MMKKDFMEEILEGVEVDYKYLWEVTKWSNKFKGISKEKQPEVLTFPKTTAKKLKEIEYSSGSVRLLSTGNYDGFTTEEKAAKYLSEGEIITITSGGKDTIKYHNGKFINSLNILSASN